MERDIADYAKDGRLTEPSDGKRYEQQKMVDAVKALGSRCVGMERDIADCVKAGRLTESVMDGAK